MAVKYVNDVCAVTTSPAISSSSGTTKGETKCENNDKSKGTRLIFYGGAKSLSDNSAFYYAAKNVSKDYRTTPQMNTAKSGKFVVDTINLQPDNSIASIDIFTHGSPTALYMVRNKKTQEYASIYKSIPVDLVEENNLYTGKFAKFIESSIMSSGGGKETDSITNIEYKKFTNNAIIEIHGCRAADEIATPYDNLVTNLSQSLFSAGKTCAVVIGHFTRANPDIYGKKTLDRQQDYRHDKRGVYHNGELLFKTTENGKISRAKIAEELNNKLSK